MITEKICDYTKRKSLLYVSKVEYGIWAINHIEGCMHGCMFPCYAYLMSKRFGRVRNYQEWLRPKIVENSLELLSKELKENKGKIDFVHLSFMTDPFMYDWKKGILIEEIKDLSLEIIRLINREGIRVTTLTKGIYPRGLENPEFSSRNEYGITIVSLNEAFKNRYEPYAAPFDLRMDSLRDLHNAGYRTWASIEPYPTPHIDPDAFHIEKLLNKIVFVDKIVFGRLNYNSDVSMFKDSLAFYEDTVREVRDFCADRKIALHIKSGTPLGNNNNMLFRSMANPSEKMKLRKAASL